MHPKSDKNGSQNVIVTKTNEEPYGPYKMLEQYLAVRPKVKGNLFIRENGSNIPYGDFYNKVKACLADAGAPASQFGTHSLRAGGATWLAAQGKSDSFIRERGRWTSDTFLQWRILRARLHEANEHTCANAIFGSLAISTTYSTQSCKLISSNICGSASFSHSPLWSVNRSWSSNNQALPACLQQARSSLYRMTLKV